MTLASKLPIDHPFAGGYPRLGGQLLPTDPDAIDYLERVKAADGGAAVEVGVAMAIDAFIKGCKADGIWSALKASCIMCGARTISGALVPLVGTAPTAVNFVSSNYNRETGLVGVPESGTYINTNRANDADGQDDRHISIYRSQGVSPVDSHYEIGAYSTTPAPVHISAVRPLSGDTCAIYGGTPAGGPTVPSPSGYTTGFFGFSRATSTGFDYRTPVSGSAFFSSTSTAPQNQNVFVFSASLNGNSPFTFSPHRLAFYSIGSSLSLSALDARVTTLVSEIAAAIP